MGQSRPILGRFPDWFELNDKRIGKFGENPLEEFLEVGTSNRGFRIVNHQSGGVSEFLERAAFNLETAIAMRKVKLKRNQQVSQVVLLLQLGKRLLVERFELKLKTLSCIPDVVGWEFSALEH